MVTIKKYCEVCKLDVNAQFYQNIIPPYKNADAYTLFADVCTSLGLDIPEDYDKTQDLIKLEIYFCQCGFIMDASFIYCKPVVMTGKQLVDNFRELRRKGEKVPNMEVITVSDRQDETKRKKFVILEDDNVVKRNNPLPPSNFVKVFLE